MRRGVTHVWMAEAVYLQTSRVWALWTTCRLTKAAAREALEEHPSYPQFTHARIVKFSREEKRRAR